MTQHECTEELFLSDVSDHEVTILKDDGVYRHIRFKRPDCGTFWFDLVTWPGYLCMTGDMGCWTFSRLDDMFEFFREYKINPGYWGEKLHAASRPEGCKEYSQDLLIQCIKDDFEAMFDFYSQEKKAGAWTDVEENLIAFVDGDNLTDDLRLVDEFLFDDFEEKFSDFWEHDFETYTFHYIWACRAIVWGISQYDAAKKGSNHV